MTQQEALAQACKDWQDLYRETVARRAAIEAEIGERFNAVLDKLGESGIAVEEFKITGRDYSQTYPQSLTGADKIFASTFQHKLQTAMLHFGCDFPAV